MKDKIMVVEIAIELGCPISLVINTAKEIGIKFINSDSLLSSDDAIKITTLITKHKNKLQHSGYIITYNDIKGFGFIKSAENDYFFHISNVVKKQEIYINKGVDFFIRHSDKKNKDEAYNINILDDISNDEDENIKLEFRLKELEHMLMEEAKDSLSVSERKIEYTKEKPFNAFNFERTNMSNYIKKICLGENNLGFGKYSDKTLEWVYENEKEYFNWCIENQAIQLKQSILPEELCY